MRFVLQMCEVAEDYLKTRQLRLYSDRQAIWTQLEQFTHLAHGRLDPRATAYTLANEGRRLIEWLGTVSPLQARQTRELLTEFRKVSNASVVGSVVSALGQGLLAAIGFAITRVPHALFFGLLTAIASFIPVVGTAIVWVPAVLLLGATGHMTSAVVLGAWCLVFVIGGEHIGKPLLLRGQVEMHTGLVFLSLLGGLEVFGLLGIIIGPLVISFFLALMRMYQRDFQRMVEVH